ncbi:MULTISPECIES: LysR family transcriptional regulator [unclassified Pseudomonas]|jgi:DNA-binding transcriptional LysR family regulator|uniref:LysR family transcriptional regulator n=1 Tax=unclassified Pseudomonas TaxID=196821 RepID=UPI000EA9E583|nr:MULTISPECIES: LysR family transcriptional regulator [unclassified Pseudomonas]AYF87589.1 LysR family transcriptional regulator [Pseudomonas sp. DY-1]MDH4656468.1 LysR family transcriptional regulator [Pseudomonas sp. BN606]MRK20167.1 LysR family transcriptional regulator [Pseudomonas sp. JG-B]
MDKFGAITMFVATAEFGSFSRAAEQLGKTPSALTKAVSHLEEELGVRLFERSTRRTVLTEAGRVYLETARQVLQRLHEVGEEVGQLQHGLYGSLRLTAPLAFGRAFLDEVCAGFLAEYPQIRLRVDLSDSFIDLVDAGYDLALREGRGDQPGLIAKTVGRNCLALCASPTYLARNPVPVTPATLDQHDWLLYRHAALSRTYWWVEKDGQRLSLLQPAAPRLESDNYDLLLANALAGGGLFHAPLWSGAPYFADGRLVRLMADYEIDPDAFGPQILAVYPSHRRATGKVLAFIDYLAGFLEQRGLA